MECVRVAGSFRDPSGYVFRRGSRLFRAVDGSSDAALRDLRASGLLGKLIESGLVVDSREVDDDQLLSDLRADNPPFRSFLEHRVIDPVTFPYEWSVSMLADAGIATLDLQRRLVVNGYSLKDATAYNIQFVRARPTFIDLTSIERPSRRDIWSALGQFGSMFTYPLLLSLRYGWDLRSCFLANLGGVPLDRAAKAIGRLGRWHPRAWLDISLPNMLGARKVGRQLDANTLLDNAKGRDNHKAQLVNLKRIRRKIGGMVASYRPRGVWADYTESCTYDEVAERRKRQAVRRFVEMAAPRSVLDLGCNTGAYSEIAAATGARVIAVDSDHDAVELLYRRLRTRPADITPMIVDLGNPSPAIGFRNRERESFSDRCRSDCVLALALAHHLLVTGNLSPADVRELCSDLTRDALIIEFIPHDDPMFVELLKRRVGPYEPVGRGAFLDVFAEQFDLVDTQRTQQSGRELLFLRKRR